MKTCTLCKVLKEDREFRFRAAAKDKLASWCNACHAARTAIWKKKNKEKVAAYMVAYRTVNKEKMKAQTLAYRAKFPDKVAQTSAAYRAKNRERIRERYRSWQKKNAAYCQAMNRARKMTMTRAMPAWANQFFIEEAYDLAARRTKLKSGGHDWEVDHIVPLRSKLVCGLHTHTNLRVITASENAKKSNKYWPDMPCLQKN